MGIFYKEPKEKKEKEPRSEPIGGDWSKKGREAKAYKKLEKERTELRDEFYKTQMETGVKKDIAIHQTNIEKERSDLARKEKELHEAERQAYLDEKAAKEAKYRTTKRYRAKQWVEGKEQEWALDRERKDAEREERIRKREEREERESARRSRQHEAEMQKLEKKRAQTELRQLRQERRSQHISDEPRYDMEEPTPKKPSKKAIAVAAAADIGMGLATGEVPGFTGDVVGGRKKTRSAPSKGNSGAQRKPKATQSKPKSQSTGKPKTAKGKTKTGSKTPSKPSKPRSTGKGKSKPKTTQKKKRSPPKKGNGGMWEYGGAGLFD